MFERRSLKLPIALGVTMIVLIVLIIIGWVLLTVFGLIGNRHAQPLYITLLSVGTVLLVFILVGVVMYLTFSIQAINLHTRQSNFVDSVTHELKSPIASLKLYLQTLNRRQVSPGEQEGFYRFMLEDVERLDHLINHLLDAGRLDKKAVGEDETEPISLDKFLASCSQAVCLRYRTRPDVAQLDVQPVSIRARRVDVDMIFRNLIDNAVKYAGEEPQVKIELHTDSRWVVVRISDNGRGIPPSERRKVFGRFVRLGLELERDKPGTGLGLYIVRTLVHRLGGRIRVRDPDSGPGTVFEVYLPIGLVSELETAPDDKPSMEVA